MRPCPFGGGGRPPTGGGQRLAQLITENLSLRKQVRRLEAELARVLQVCQDTHRPKGRPHITPRTNGAARRPTT